MSLPRATADEAGLCVLGCSPCTARTSSWALTGGACGFVGLLSACGDQTTCVPAGGGERSCLAGRDQGPASPVPPARPPWIQEGAVRGRGAPGPRPQPLLLCLVGFSPFPLFILLGKATLGVRCGLRKRLPCGHEGLSCSCPRHCRERRRLKEQGKGRGSRKAAEWCPLGPGQRGRAGPLQAGGMNADSLRRQPLNRSLRIRLSCRPGLHHPQSHVGWQV